MQIPTSTLLTGALAAAFLVSACSSTPSEPAVTADTWAVVDGRPITKDATEKAFRRVRDPNERSPPKRRSPRSWRCWTI